MEHKEIDPVKDEGRSGYQRMSRVGTEEEETNDQTGLSYS